MDNIMRTWEDNLEKACVGHELHQDGNSHLHCAIWLKSVVDLSGADCLDHLGGSHGDYRSMRNQKKCLEYVTKDGDYITHCMSVEELLKAWDKKKSVQANEVAIAIRDGGNVSDVESRYPGFFLMNKRKIEEYHGWIQRKKAKPQLRWHPLIHKMSYSTETSMIVGWLNSNILKERQLRQKQLYIWGLPGLGKTYLIEKLSERLRVYFIPREDWETDYEDGLYDVAVIDEFKGQKTLQWMNQWLDGQQMRLKQKGVDGGVKRQRIPTIILSNKDPRAVYHNTDIVYVDAFLDRLTVVNVVSMIDIDWECIFDVQSEF